MQFFLNNLTFYITGKHQSAILICVQKKKKKEEKASLCCQKPKISVLLPSQYVILLIFLQINLYKEKETR